MRHRKRTNNEVRLWVRMGDGGDYESYGDDFDAVASLLRATDQQALVAALTAQEGRKRR